MICSPRGIDGCCWRSGLLWRQNCPQVAALELVSSFVLQNSVTGPEKKLEKAIDLAYTTLMHVQLCSNAHLIMWLAHCILCKQQLISCRLQLAYMYSVAVLIIPMQLARSYSCMTSPRHQHLWCYFSFIHSFCHLELCSLLRHNEGTNKIATWIYRDLTRGFC